MVTEKEIGVYGKLFDIAAGNMESAGKEMEIDRDAFLAVVHMDPHRADMLRLAGNSVTMMMLERGRRREADSAKTA